MLNQQFTREQPLWELNLLVHQLLGEIGLSDDVSSSSCKATVWSLTDI